MKDQQLDEIITKTLHNHSNSDSMNKEEMWENIAQELQLKQSPNEDAVKEEGNDQVQHTQERLSKEKNMKKTNDRKGNKWGLIITFVAAASIVGVMVTSNTGQAFVNQIKQYFEPEKKVIEEYEGMPEEKDIVLQDTESGYIIYIDEERYKLVQKGNQDIIVPKVPLEERYPEVSMSIQQMEGVLPEQVIAEQQQLLAEKYDKVEEPVQVTEPLEATLIAAKDGQSWDSPVVKVYVLPNGYGGSFVITEKYFLEAAEGHGARFYYMLEQFMLVDPKQ